jgi:hypothetical protein
MSITQPRFPLYIPSKGRADSRFTAKALEGLNVPYRLVVEEQEWGAYRHAGVPERSLLVLDKAYQRDYDTCDEFGDTKSKGPGPARNFIWEHSISEGHPWHWVMDDNIRWFYRFHKNRRIRMGDGTGFHAMEDFCLRYKNIGMAGPNYRFFVAEKLKYPPFVMNTRIYSCNLIRNDVPYRWRGRYNEDTDLSLQMLKNGWCTVQFNAFLQDKMATQQLGGGNTEAFYAGEGTYAKSKMLLDMHPDVTKMVWKFSRVHHHVNYNGFKSMPLIRNEDVEITDARKYEMAITKVKGAK